MRPHTSYYCDMCPHTSYYRICVPSSLPAQYSLALCACSPQSAPHAVYVRLPVCISCYRIYRIYRICVPSSLPTQYSLALRTLVTHMLLAAPAARPAVPAALAAIAACLAAVQGVLLKKEEPQHNLNSVLIQP